MHSRPQNLKTPIFLKKIEVFLRYLAPTLLFSFVRHTRTIPHAKKKKKKRLRAKGWGCED